MDAKTHFDPLEQYAEIERLAGKVYFRFSHLFLHHAELRDFWWQMAMDEVQHSSVLLSCKQLIESCPKKFLDPSISQEKADQLKAQISAYLSKGTPSITMEEAFKVALEIETSELDVIYSKLLKLGNTKIAKTMENLAVPASVQRKKLKSAVLRFSNNAELRKAVIAL